MSTQQKVNRNVELLHAQLRDYLDTRAQAAMRINPKLEMVYEDIAWQQMTQVHIVLSSGKAFGATKYIVADILLSDDEAKTKDLLNPTNQVSILPEIVQMRDDKGHKTAGTLEIHDMPTFYKALDPSLEKIITLVQCWLWWDVEDSCDYVKFEQALQRVQHIDHSGVPEALANYYAEQFRVQPAQMTKEVVVGHELGRAAEFLRRFQARRDGDEGYKIIIKREPTKENSPDVLMRAIGRQMMTYDAVKESKVLDDAMRANFARALNVSAAELTVDMALAALERAIDDGKTRLRSALTGHGSGSRSFDYKQSQLEHIKTRMEQVAQGRPPQRLSAPRPDGGQQTR